MVGAGDAFVSKKQQVFKNLSVFEIPRNFLVIVVLKVEWRVAVFLVLYFRIQSCVFVYRVSCVLYFVHCLSCILCFVFCTLSIVYLVFCVACLCSGQLANLKLDLHLEAVWGQR